MLRDETNATEVNFDGLSFNSHDKITTVDKAGYSNTIKGWQGYVIPIVKMAENFSKQTNRMRELKGEGC